MEIKKGFKNTEVGVIPRDWEVRNIVENSTMKARIGWQGLKVAEYMDNGDYYLITGTDFNDGKIKWETCHFVEKERFAQDKNIQIKVGDILITKDGTIGKLAYIDHLPMPATLNSGVFAIRPKDNDYLTQFLFYIFNSFYFQDFLNKLVAGSTIIHLYQKDFVNFNFPLPPTLTEQTAIAAFLNDTDNLINNLEQLLAKKRAIKTGAMQELLASTSSAQGKPKKGWVVKKLGEVGEVKMCRRIFNYETQSKGAIPFYKIGTFGKEADAFITESLYNSYKQRFSFPKKGDILISAAGTIGRTIVYDGKPAYYQDSNIVWIDNKENLITNNFLYHIFQIAKYNTEGGTIQRLYNGILKNTKFFCPPTKSEQTSIARILSDMDAEIQALEKKIEKYKMIKQGMMRVLLTGKIRLMRPEKLVAHESQSAKNHV